MMSESPYSAPSTATTRTNDTGKPRKPGDQEKRSGDGKKPGDQDRRSGDRKKKGEQDQVTGDQRNRKLVSFSSKPGSEKVKVTAKKEEQLTVNTFRFTMKFLGKARRRSSIRMKAKAKGPPPGFKVEKMTACLEELLEEELEDYRYDGDSANVKVKQLTSAILDDVKEKELGRYKYVCYVTIGDVSNQSLEIATRCLSNADTDDYVSASCVKNGYYAVAVLHAMHFD